MRRFRNTLIPAAALMLALGQFNDVDGRDRVIVNCSSDGYRLRAPNEWTVVRSTPGVDSVISRDAPRCAITVVVTPAPRSTGVTDADLQKLYKMSGAVYSSRTFVKQRVEKLQGKPSGWFEFTGELKDVPGLALHFRQYIVVHRGRVYQLLVSAPERSWKESVPHWRKVVASIELL